jgi:hypothetical protein
VVYVLCHYNHLFFAPLSTFGMLTGWNSPKNILSFYKILALKSLE